MNNYASSSFNRPSKPELFFYRLNWMLPNAFKTFLILSSQPTIPAQKYSLVPNYFPGECNNSLPTNIIQSFVIITRIGLRKSNKFD